MKNVGGQGQSSGMVERRVDRNLVICGAFGGSQKALFRAQREADRTGSGRLREYANGTYLAVKTKSGGGGGTIYTVKGSGSSEVEETFSAFETRQIEKLKRLQMN